ncbi:MAG: hypothetical protein WBQ43_04085 [Terriglobales bacterium]
MHHRKAGKIGLGGRRVARYHIQIGLGPPQTGRARQNTNQTVLNIGQLRTGGGADSIYHHQRVHDIAGRGKVVRPAINGVGEAIGQVSSAFAQDGIGDRSVVVVNDSNRSAGPGEVLGMESD